MKLGKDKQGSEWKRKRKYIEVRSRGHTSASCAGRLTQGNFGFEF